jgi:NADPH-dependent glutamate synthase beta subunit-like oxidoreductase/NAD(P)H-flavin reductase
MPHTKHKLKLRRVESQDFSFKDLWGHAGLKRLDDAFLGYLTKLDPDLCEQLHRYRRGHKVSRPWAHHGLVKMAPLLEDFLANLFDIEDSVAKLSARALAHAPIFAFKKHWVMRLARRYQWSGEVPQFKTLDQQLVQAMSAAPKSTCSTQDREWAVATWAMSCLENPETHAVQIEQLTQWCVLALKSPEGQLAVQGWVSFQLPRKLHPDHLVPTKPVPGDPLERLHVTEDQWQHRDGFALTDPRMTQRHILNEANYCVYCHKSDTDFCAKGFPVKKTQKTLGFKVNALGDTLTGCPLEEPISQMQYLHARGHSVASLAVIMTTNPMCPATGHRICNDCMKSCIYQKQDPVDIPQVETHALTQVLQLPWGVEIYDLLTRWNPLRQDQWVTQPFNGKKVLVMGMGPAGFTLAHHLLQAGCAVVGMDGLKIEPLPKEMLNQPIKHFSDWVESLDERLVAGFGGVAEYGITVRWDKNFLKLIYLSLVRRRYFQIYGQVRLGGTLTFEDAWDLGFDHLALAVGAGLPKELRIAHSLAPGMRHASDFLMTLQLTGAAKANTLVNLEVALPAVVIGGGLTAIDTATEVQAYYIVQVEKLLTRYEKLSDHFGVQKIRDSLTGVQLARLDESVAHGLAVRDERLLAQQQNRAVQWIPLLRQWGGVTVVYRKAMESSPAYRRNHQELMEAMREGIYYAEGLQPESVELDEAGWVKALCCQVHVLDEQQQWQTTDQMKVLPARTILVATGAKPNVAYGFEYRDSIERQGFAYLRFEDVAGQLKPIHTLSHCKDPAFGAFTSYNNHNRRVSLLGDTHAVFHGSVVKAIASAKAIYPKILSVLGESDAQVGTQSSYALFRKQLAHLFSATLVGIKQLNERWAELEIYAPMAAKKFQPGQMYRVQSFESNAPFQAGTLLHMEALPAVAYSKRPDHLLFLVDKGDIRGRLAARLKKGAPMALMGPSGVRASIPIGDNPQAYLVVGDEKAFAYVLSVAPALKKAGHRVFFVAVLQDSPPVLKKELEAALDAILWVSEHPVDGLRPQDRCVPGDWLTQLTLCAQNPMAKIPFSTLDHVMVIGDGAWVKKVQCAKKKQQLSMINAKAQWVAAAYGPMQCMLKGVCAQCLQWQIDPVTGKRTKAVYACSWQHQPMQMIDVDHLAARDRHQALQASINQWWLDYVNG